MGGGEGLLWHSREMEYIECSSFIEIYWSLVSLAHFMIFMIFKYTQHLNTLYMPMGLLFVLKWVKSVEYEQPSIYSISLILVLPSILDPYLSFARSRQQQEQQQQEQQQEQQQQQEREEKGGE